jgi:hypothetical protein
MYTRANAKWTVNECLRLEREFDLLKLSVQEIALLHDRSPNAIMYKLDAEGLADYNDVFINRQALKVETKDESASELDEDDTSNYEDECEDDDDEEEFDSYNIKQQVQIITKQLANLTAIVYKVLTPSGTPASSFC